MCGISFIFQPDGNPQANVIARMVTSLTHRGPDAQTHWLGDGVALGHSRLSIVDIHGGQQPMRNDDGRYTLVFNGEIYNYRELRQQLQAQGDVFHTDSDTEVLLRLYLREGSACLQRLRGMFAFAVHDKKSGTLFLARDRLGIKPLYYHWDGSTLTGASEVKAIFASGNLQPQLDPATIRSYFRYQFTTPGTHPFKGIDELAPGHHLTISPGKAPKIQPYWDLEFPRDSEYESLDEDYWLGEFDAALSDAARSHTIGDVPIGAYLSGGIDSATTTLLLNEASAQDIKSFTIRFSDPELDESDLAAEIAAHLGVDNQSVTVADERPEGYLSELLQCIYHLEQPQRMAVDVPHFMLSGLVREQHHKVVYTGDGADEILGGYDCYRQDAIREWGNEYLDAEQREQFYLQEFGDDFAEAHLRYLLHQHQPEQQTRTLAQFGCYPAWHDFWHILDDTAEALFSDALLDNAARSPQDDTASDPLLTYAASIKPRIERYHPLNQSLYIETKTRLPNWILHKSDRLSMAHSVEARIPFMDHKLVELTARIPPALKLNETGEKYILRKLMTSRLPEHPASFQKRAFYTPIREWFFTPQRQQELSTYLSDDALRDAGFFRPDTVRDYLQRINQFGQPQDMDQYYTVMKLEWALMLVLTTQMLHHLFVRKNAACFAP